MTPRRQTWMWLEACELVERAERLQRQFFEPGHPGTRRPSWVPPADVLEDAHELVVLVALPGVPAECVEVVIGTDDLRVVGERPLPAEMHSAVIRRLEIPYGRFERSIPLPPGRYELSRRELVLGCLVMCLRKLD